MGIYANYRKGPATPGPVPGTDTWTEYEEWPGFTKSRTVTATRWVETSRDDCFCCSCDDERPGSDPACRNHGWAAKRPCDTHKLPGQTWGEEAGEALDGVMPLSTQEYRKKGGLR